MDARVAIVVGLLGVTATAALASAASKRGIDMQIR